MISINTNYGAYTLPSQLALHKNDEYSDGTIIQWSAHK